MLFRSQLLPVDENTVVLMIVSENGKVQNNAVRLNDEYDEQMLRILSKSMTYSYKARPSAKRSQEI